MQYSYEQFLREFATAAGLSDPSEIARGKRFALGGVDFAVLRDQERHDAILVYTDVGRATGEAEELAFASLLVENFFDSLVANATYGLSPVTGHVVHVRQVLIGEASPKALKDALERQAELARNWRDAFGEPADTSSHSSEEVSERATPPA